MRAITKGLLVARRTNDGWSIEERDFDAWASAHAQPTSTKEVSPTPVPTLEVAVLEERIRGLEALVAEMSKRVDAANQRGDEWKILAERPWWKRLVG